MKVKLCATLSYLLGLCRPKQIVMGFRKKKYFKSLIAS